MIERTFRGAGLLLLGICGCRSIAWQAGALLVAPHPRQIGPAPFDLPA